MHSRPTPCSLSRAWFVLGALALLSVVAPRSWAEARVVTTLADAGPGSLRATIAAANSGDLITFAPTLSGGTITLSGGELLVTQDLRIQGLGMNALTISGGGNSRIFHVTGTLILEKLTLANGNAGTGNGGAILSAGRGVALKDCKIVSCTAEKGGGIYQGDPVERPARVYLFKCWLTANTAQTGGGLQVDSGEVRVMNCTFDHNVAIDGGAVWLANFPESITTPVTHLGNSTFSANRATTGRGAALWLSGGFIEIWSCTIYENEGASGVHAETVLSNGVKRKPTLRLSNTVVARTRAAGTATLAALTADLSANEMPGMVPDTSFIGNNEGMSSVLQESNSTNPLTTSIGTRANPLDPKLAPLETVNDLPLHKPMSNSPLIGRGYPDAGWRAPYNMCQAGGYRAGTVLFNSAYAQDTIGAVVVTKLAATTGPAATPEPQSQTTPYAPSPKILAFVAFRRVPGGAFDGLLWGSNFLEPNQCTARPTVGFVVAGRTLTFGGQITEQHDDSMRLSGAIAPTLDFTLLINVCGQTSYPEVRFGFDSMVITGVEPGLLATAGQTGVFIRGKNLAGATAVSLGGRAGDVLGSTLEGVHCNLPPGAGTDVPLVVVTGSRQSKPYSVSFLPPIIVNVSPGSFPTLGVRAVLTGTNLGENPTVIVDNVGRPALPPSNHEMITFDLPEGEGTGHTIQVRTGNQTSGPILFSYAKPRLDNAKLPENGLRTTGGSVELTGLNFGRTPRVYVDGAVAPVGFASQSRIVVQFPAGQGAGHLIKVVASGQESNVLAVSYAAPVINTLLPVEITTMGGAAQLQGSNFGTSPVVLVDGAAAPVITWTHTSVNFTMPLGQGASRIIQVLAAGQASAPKLFNTARPKITDFTPKKISTLGGTVTVQGSSFGATPLVFIDGVGTLVLRATHTELTFAVPPGSGLDRTFKISVGGLESLPATLTSIAPVITDLSPPKLPTSGGILSLTGTNFGTAPMVLVDGREIRPTTSSHTHLTFAAPTGEGLAHTVVVRAGTQLSPPKTFGFDAPFLLLATAGTYPTAGGVPLSLRGQNFGLNPVVRVGGTQARLLPLPPTADPHRELLAELPPGQGVGVPVRVTVGGQQSPALYLNYDPPTVSSVLTRTGSTAGGTTVLITGTNLGTDPAVVFGDAAATIVQHTHTFIECRTPRRSNPGAVPIIVVVGNRRVYPDWFTYVRVPLRLTIEAPTDLVSVGRTLRSLARMTYDDQTTADVTPTTSWFTSSAAVADVRGGNVTGIAPGSCTIVARVSGLEASADFQVRAVPEYLVTTAANAGPGSLREGLEVTSPGGLVQFDPALAGREIVLTSTIEIPVPLTLRGLGAERLKVRSSGFVNLLSVTSPLLVQVEGLTLTRGAPAIMAKLAALSLRACVFSDNQSRQGSAVEAVGGNLTVEDCYFVGGLATNGGALHLTAVDLPGPTAVLRRSTFYANGAATSGGAIYHDGVTLRAENCTFSSNQAERGSAIWSGGTLALNFCTLVQNVSQGAQASGAVHALRPAQLDRCLVALNTPFDLGAEPPGAFQSLGHNLIGSNQGVATAFPPGLPNANTDLVGTSSQLLDPKVGALGDHGGPTRTHPLLAGSPAIDRATNTSAPATDQRGLPRIVNQAADIGAFEVQAP